MLPRPLRQDEQAKEDEGRNHGRSQRAAERKAAIAHRLVEEVADGSAERPCEDEGRPENQHARDVRPQVKPDDCGQPRGEHDRAAFVAEATGTGQPVTERGAERLREGDAQ